MFAGSHGDVLRRVGQVTGHRDGAALNGQPAGLFIVLRVEAIQARVG